MEAYYKNKVPKEALGGSMKDFRVLKNPNLMERCEAFFEWQDLRRQSGTWPFSRATESGPQATCAVRDDSGYLMTGVNFASQDYLSLSSHNAVLEAAKSAIDTMGVHSAGSPALVGNTSTSIALESELADFLKMQNTILFPTGWAAGFGVIKGIVRSHDHIVMDSWRMLVCKLAHKQQHEISIVTAILTSITSVKNLQQSEVRTRMRAL